MPNSNAPRHNPLHLPKDVFKKMGYKMIDDIADLLENINDEKVTRNSSSATILEIMGNSKLPENGADPEELLKDVTRLLFNHSLFNGHPRFWGYITSSATPIGILSECLAASVNPNVGAQILSPVATQIEKQTIKWLADFIGYNSDCGGLLVSGGNMANFVGFITAVNFATSKGLDKRHLTFYYARSTHTWIEKAAELFGLEKSNARSISIDINENIDLNELKSKIETDRNAGCTPFLIIGTAGTVGTGAIDPLRKLGFIANENDMWFHVDGAYGAPAAILPEADDDLKSLAMADSIALDPHKWLYSPLEAGCALVKDQSALLQTFSHNPSYYKFENTDNPESTNYHEHGLQNSRGFRALKVWMALKQIGENGYVQLIRDDIRLAKIMYDEIMQSENLEAFTHNLSITTFRFNPVTAGSSTLSEEYLNTLNENILDSLQRQGEVFISNVILGGKYCLRACIVNFRTDEHDVKALPEIVTKVGMQVHEQLFAQNKK